MGHTLLRWIIRALVAVVVLIVVVVAAVFAISTARLGRRYAVNPPQVTIPTDAAVIERGRHLAVAITKCGDCHGESLGGSVFIDAPPFRITGPNLTRGQGGVGARLSDEDWVRAVRHGVGQDGHGLLVMPSEEYIQLAESDLAAIIAYVKSVPPVDNTPTPVEIRPLGRILRVAGQIPPPAAAIINHQAPFSAPIPAGVTVEYGRYLATVGGCVGCHGPGLSGGRVPGVPPDFPPASNITPAGAIGQWSEADFFRSLREGKRPNGTSINPFMPWKAAGQMTDDEIRAVWVFLRSVPAKPYGNR
jgi:mono/diheme cytochrome c family protein